MAAASESVRLAEPQYRIGKVDLQRLVDSHRGLVNLQDQLTASRGQVAMNLVAVYKSLGGGWQATAETGFTGDTVGMPLEETRALLDPAPTP